MTIKRTLQLAIIFSVVVLGASCTTTRNIKGKIEHDVNFTILQINDVYKIEGLVGGSIGGIARIRTLRKQLEAKGKRVLVLHAGDLLFPSVMSKYLNAQPMVRTLNLLDGEHDTFDKDFIVVFGNHEFDNKDPGLLLGRLAQSEFLWVSSNVRYRSEKESYGNPFSVRLKNVYDTITTDIDGVLVGIFGITIDSQPQDYVAYDYGNIADRNMAIRVAIGSLKAKGAKMIIALTHQDIDQDEQLAKDFPEIDLIIGGHEHFYIQRKVKGTWITKADSDAQSAIVYDVRISPDKHIEIAAPQKIIIDQKIEKDPLVDAEVNTWLDKLSKEVKKQTGRDLMEVLGTTEHTLEGMETAIRGRETALGNLLADVVRDRMKTDLAFVNSGSVRINDNISPGPIRNYDMEGIFYFDNKLVSFELTGKEILDILRNSVSKAHLGDGRFLQVSGIKFKYHTRNKRGRIKYRIEAEDVEIKPQGTSTYVPLELNRKYTAATQDYNWEYGYRDGYKIFSKGNKGSSPELLESAPDVKFRRSVEEAIAALPDRKVTTRIEGRIVEVKE